VVEGYAKAVVQPTIAVSRTVLWKGIDVGLIDGLLVNGSAVLTKAFAWAGSQLQTGRVGTYAWIIVLGAVMVLGAFTFF
jgi:NADH-quinone oxidoreductase subunit L